MVHSVFLLPVEGSLDVAAIDAFLAARPDVLLDPLGSGMYMVCGVPRAVAEYRRLRIADPSQFPYVVLVTVKADAMNVFQEYGDAARLRSAREIVRWVIEHQRCRIKDEYDADWTERVAEGGVGVLYPPQLA